MSAQKPVGVAVTAVSLPRASLADAKPLMGFDYGSDIYHVLCFDFGDEGGAIGIWREGDDLCARISLDAIAEFWLRAKADHDAAPTIPADLIERRARDAAIERLIAAAGDVVDHAEDGFVGRQYLRRLRRELAAVRGGAQARSFSSRHYGNGDKRNKQEEQKP